MTRGRIREVAEAMLAQLGYESACAEEGRARDRNVQEWRGMKALPSPPSSWTLPYRAAWAGK